MKRFLASAWDVTVVTVILVGTFVVAPAAFLFALVYAVRLAWRLGG